MSTHTSRSTPPKGTRLRRWLRRALVGLAVAGALSLVFWFVVIPYPRGLDDQNPELTALMEQRLEEARARGDSLVVRQEWVPLSDISRNLQRAVVVAEDYRFREHQGIDWVSLADEVEWSGDEDFRWTSWSDLEALAQALSYVWENRSELRGRSTLTQQLAKNLYFGTDRSLLRKAMEAVVARRLERQLSKDRILELYLNIAEWGPGIFGAEAASRHYFGRPASSLSLSQAATLAGTLPHPLTSNARTSPSRMLWRKELILDRIDPSRGIPTIPSPLPPPDFDVGLDPADSDPMGIDTTGVDTLRPDTMAVDTLRPDTTAVDTLRPDTTLAGVGPRPPR